MKNLLGHTIRVSCRSAISLSLSLHITPLNKKTTHNLLTQSHNFTHNVFAFTNFTYAFVLISFNLFTYYACVGVSLTCSYGYVPLFILHSLTHR